MTNPAPAPAQFLKMSQTDAEAFLYREARMLDQWRIDEWLALFTEDGRYCIPPAGSQDDADPMVTLFYADDDHFLLSERVKRLNKRTAHSEYPRSICRHFITNVEIMSAAGAEFQVAANFLVYRTKGGTTDVFPGHYLYDLTMRDGEIKIRKKSVFIDLEDLTDQTKVSIIL